MKLARNPEEKNPHTNAEADTQTRKQTHKQRHRQDMQRQRGLEAPKGRQREP